MADSLSNGEAFPPTNKRGQGTTRSKQSDQTLKSAPEFEGYKIIAELPRGGQALVYKAMHKATKMKVALKVLAPGLLLSAKARQRFEREVDLISGLEHPYIVSIRNSGISSGQYYFAMEYIHGSPLDKYISSEHLSVHQIMELFLKICDAIAHAHRRGVIHRDIKPSNILVDERGDPHVLDFGLAKAPRSHDQDVTLMSITGEIKGTLEYMSPEQASGKANLVDTRTDVYSLGIVLYRILLGQFPYDVSGSTTETLRNIETCEPVRPRTIDHKFDSDIETILLVALAKHPDQRYGSAVELHDDIQHWLADLPLSAKSASSIYLLRKIFARHRYTSTVLALLLIIIVAFSCSAFLMFAEVRRNRTEIQERNKIISETENKLQYLNSQFVIVHMLRMWNKGRDEDAIMAGRAIPEGKRGAAARDFIFDERPITEKKDAFIRQIRRIETNEQRTRFFTNFVVAEHYLREGNLKLAQEFFSKSLSEHVDMAANGYIVQHIRERLADTVTGINHDETGSK